MTDCKLLRLCLLIRVFQQFPLSLELFGLLFCCWRIDLLNFWELLVEDWKVGVKPCSQFSHSNTKSILLFVSIFRWKAYACINEILGFCLENFWRKLIDKSVVFDKKVRLVRAKDAKFLLKNNVSNMRFVKTGTLWDNISYLKSLFWKERKKELDVKFSIVDMKMLSIFILVISCELIEFMVFVNYKCCTWLLIDVLHFIWKRLFVMMFAFILLFVNSYLMTLLLLRIAYLHNCINSFTLSLLSYDIGITS